MNMEKVETFCAVRGKPCNKKIEVLGEESFFIAYPFRERYKDISLRIETLLRARNKKTEVPKPLRSGSGLIFCDNLCPMIRSTSNFIADITQLNYNVFFEVGFALGLEKNIYLIKNAALKSGKSKLSEIFYFIKYETPEDVLKAILSKERESFDEFYLKKEEIDHIPDSVSLLLPDDKYHMKYIGEAIEEVIREYDLRIVEESGIGVDLERTLEKIQSSEWIICDFVSDETRNSFELNIDILFFLGFSIGQGKKVLVFQEKPVERSIVDLAGLIQNYNGIEDLREKLNGMISLEYSKFSTEKELYYINDELKTEIERNQVIVVPPIFVKEMEVIKKSSARDSVILECPDCGATITVRNPKEGDTVLCKDCKTELELVRLDGEWDLLKPATRVGFIRGDGPDGRVPTRARGGFGGDAPPDPR